MSIQNDSPITRWKSKTLIVGLSNHNSIDWAVFYLKIFKLYIEKINTMKNVYIFPGASTIPIHNQGNGTQLMP